MLRLQQRIETWLWSAGFVLLFALLLFAPQLFWVWMIPFALFFLRLNYVMLKKEQAATAQQEAIREQRLKRFQRQLDEVS